ncbi:MAG: hypothetical protein AMS26_06910 [Bacteroides sp. SM23_62]|nr:MAG: hypothetical protein AMS26_06910 [Bacteroides sp. SM23_62]
MNLQIKVIIGNVLITSFGSKNIHIWILTLLAWICIPSAAQQTNTVNAPLFVDPNYQGSCDPEIIYNDFDSTWYIYYTGRRTLVQNTWLRTPIGVASSKDFVNWIFEGYCQFDGMGGQKDAEATYWAPAMISNQEKLHMFLTYQTDTSPDTGPWGSSGSIVHYETSLSEPLNGWKKIGDVNNSLENLDRSIRKDEWERARILANSLELKALDATVFKHSGLFHIRYMYYDLDGRLSFAHKVSSDLSHWEDRKFASSGDAYNEEATGLSYEEAPYIFRWKGKNWLITDPHLGLYVYKSDDISHWDFQGVVLKEAGNRPYDNSRGRHCSVAVLGDRAFIFYHVEYNRQYDGPSIYNQSFENRKSVIQMAELELVDGQLVCNRDKEITPPTRHGKDIH